MARRYSRPDRPAVRARAAGTFKMIACPSAASGCTRDSTLFGLIRENAAAPVHELVPQRSQWSGWKWTGSVRSAFNVGAPWHSFTARAGRSPRRSCVTAGCSPPSPTSRTLRAWLSSRCAQQACSCRGQGWPSRAESRSRDSRLGDSAKMSDSATRRLGDSATRRLGDLGLTRAVTRP